MFVKAVKKQAGALKRIQAAVRFQSSAQQQSETVVAPETASTKPKAPRRRNVDDLFDIVNAEYTELTPLFDKFIGKLTRDVENGKVSRRAVIPVGNILLKKIGTIKEATNIDVPDHILYERVINSLIKNQVLHGSHLMKYIKSLILDKKYSKALNVYVENLQYFKDHPEALKNFIKGKEVSSEIDLKKFGAVLYIMSLKETQGKFDEEFFKLLTNGTPIYVGQLFGFFKFHQIPEEVVNEVVKVLNERKAQSFDINGNSHLSAIAKMSDANLLVKLEDLAEKSLAKYANKESEIQPSTLCAYMKAFNKTNHPSKVSDLWAFGQKHGIIDASKPQIEFWNQLLLSQLNSRIANKEEVIASLWGLINSQSKPNSESYSIYIKCLIKMKKYDEIMKLINDIKVKSPELWNSELKCDTIRTLVASGKVDEALSLFKLYSQENDFNADAGTYNVIINELMNKNLLSEASVILDKMTHDSKFQPDIFTWTSIINLLMRTASKSGLSNEETLNHLMTILKTMKEADIRVNNVTLFMVLNNLLKNPQTAETGFYILLELEKNNDITFSDIGYTGIITGMIQNGNVSKALEYYNKAIKSGVKPTAQMYNSILKGYQLTPDVKATREFYESNVLKAEKSDSRAIAKPNGFTYYFMLTQAIKNDDKEFIQYVIDEVAQRPQLNLGRVMPSIFLKLKENSFKIPESLLKRIQ